ncbi:MAG: T9SS type A sorting domain-containing protein [Chitinophagaceae bacterium]|nr:MAG: T9SS type A sorting domain-containing protein [Chitinophagaceae bacterium]
MKKALLCMVALLSILCARSADYYWVGGGGNWTDLAHWRLASPAGSIPGVTPSPSDNVFFGGYSGFGTTAPANTVTLQASGFCDNMTWEAGVPNNPVFISSDSTVKLQVSGNVVLSPATTYSLVIVFAGNSSGTIKTNGPVLGEFGMEINRPGGGLVVTDSLVVPAVTNIHGTNAITLTSGTFDVSGRTMKVFQFLSQNNNTRTIAFTGAWVSTYRWYRVSGRNKTIDASGAVLDFSDAIIIGGIYGRVSVSGGTTQDAVRVDSAEFSSIRFTHASPVLNTGLGIDNRSDTVIFSGRGNIALRNDIGFLRFEKKGELFGTNRIGKMECLDDCYISLAGGIVDVDSLIFAASHTYTLYGTLNIGKYFFVPGQPCESFTAMYGYPSTILQFAPGAVVDISNALLDGVRAAGPVTPIAVTGFDAGLNTGFVITEASGPGGTRYWVGGSGNWNDRTHWSITSGGAGGACLPFRANDVVFDINSGLNGTSEIRTATNSFCKNMTWNNVGNVSFYDTTALLLRIYGSLVMDPSVTMNSVLDFSGDASVDITTNGSTFGAVEFRVTKTVPNSVTLTDDWINPAGGSIVLNQGNLDISGRVISIATFSSTNPDYRNVDISNTDITLSNRWAYIGFGKTINTGGSHITANSLEVRAGDPLYYPWVDVTGTGGVGFRIEGTDFGRLTFLSASPASNAGLGQANHVRRLEFKGAGFLQYSNQLDSVFFAAGRRYRITDVTYVWKYLKTEGGTCGAPTEFRGPGRFTFSDTTVVDVSNTYFQDIAANSIAPVPVNGYDGGGNYNWIFTSPAGSPRYWVGGAGDWHDSAHWSTTSGGAGGACIPSIRDDVFFNGQSGFTPTGRNVSVTSGNVFFRNLDWTDAANNPVWSRTGSWTTEAWGDSIILNPSATFNIGSFTLRDSTDTFLRNTVAGNFDWVINKAGGGLTLLDNYSNPLTDILLVNGELNMPGKSVNINSIDNSGLSNASGIDITNAVVTTATRWRYSGDTTSHALRAEGSSITANDFNTLGFAYNRVSISGPAASSATIGNTRIDSLVFTNTAAGVYAGIFGDNNRVNYLEYKGSGGIIGSGNSVGTMVFFPGKNYRLPSFSNLAITDKWFASGTPCNPVRIESSSTAGNAIVTLLGGRPEFDYVSVQNITAAGAVPVKASSHSIDAGSNSGWDFDPYNPASPVRGLGPDSEVTAGGFPYVIRTEGFYGSPLTSYNWNDNSTGDSLVVTTPGTYSVRVTLPDGCVVDDQVVITEGIPLPVTFTGFNVRIRPCEALLDWQVTDVSGFSHFVVERSNDGSLFEGIERVQYTPGTDSYNFADNNPQPGINFYRLKCVDIDGYYKFSRTIAADPACNAGSIRVYPTITSGMVTIQLPQAFERAQVFVMDVNGQRMPASINGAGTQRTISLERLSPATYFVQVVNGKEVKNFKVIRK